MAEGVVKTKLRRRASPLIVLGLIFALAALLAWLLPSQQPDPPGELKFTLLDGRTLTLAELRGRPVLVAFWATSCAPCVEEVPDFIQLYRDYRPRRFELIAVAMPYDPPLHVQKFVQQHDVPYPVALDLPGEAAKVFGGVDFIPQAFLLNTSGEIVYRQVGKLDLERVQRLLEALLKEK